MKSDQASQKRSQGTKERTGENKSMGTDRRVIILLTLSLIVVTGLVIRLLPDSGGQNLTLLPTDAPSNIPASPSSAHVAERTREEVDLRFKQGVIMLHAKQYEHAATALHRVLELAPAMPEAHVNMGYAMLGLHRNTVARDFFRGAIALRASQGNAYYGLALSLAELDDLSGAIAAMRSYLSLTSPNDRFFNKGKAALGSWQTKLSAHESRPKDVTSQDK